MRHLLLVLQIKAVENWEALNDCKQFFIHFRKQRSVQVWQAVNGHWLWNEMNGTLQCKCACCEASISLEVEMTARLQLQDSLAAGGSTLWKGSWLSYVSRTDLFPECSVPLLINCSWTKMQLFPLVPLNNSWANLRPIRRLLYSVTCLIIRRFCCSLFLELLLLRLARQTLCIVSRVIHK